MGFSKRGESLRDQCNLAVKVGEVSLSSSCFHYFILMSLRVVTMVKCRVKSFLGEYNITGGFYLWSKYILRILCNLPCISVLPE